MGKHKKNKPEKHTNDRSNSSSEDEWVEKPPVEKPPPPAPPSTQKREDWMSMPSAFQTVSASDRRKERDESRKAEKLANQYDPKQNVRELNPFWRDGGDGLPSTSRFKRPSDADSDRRGYKREREHKSGWKKSKSGDENVVTNIRDEETANTVTNEEVQATLSDKEMNVLAAKLVKAEIMGNTQLVAELKVKLEDARKARDASGTSETEVVLTRTDSRGYTRPVQHQSNSDQTRKKRKVETHVSGERVRYFADDDKYSLKQMYENEKFSTAQDKNEEFVKMCGKVGKNDDLDDIFTDKIRQGQSSEKEHHRDTSRAIQEHQQQSFVLDTCNLCIQSERMRKHLMISMSSTFFLSLPSHEPLTEGHCVLAPVRHVPCATQLEENEWAELLDYRRALTKMFASSGEDVIFFETAMNLKGFPHMRLECVPVDKEQGDEAPIYFKKAIDESEMEWAMNKKLVPLRDRDVRRAIPKGLPYFCVSFGMEEGFAHVIENERMFPSNFAQEIIGGMLDLHHSKWRKPRREGFDEQSKRVGEFNKRWTPFDFTQTQ